MSFLTGVLGFIVTFLMLRRKGSVGRHIGAFVLGMVVAILPFGAWVGAHIPPGGAYKSEWLAVVWLFGIAVCIVWQILAMLIALPVRRRAARKAAATVTGA